MTCGYCGKPTNTAGICDNINCPGNIVITTHNTTGIDPGTLRIPEDTPEFLMCPYCGKQIIYPYPEFIIIGGIKFKKCGEDI